MLGSRGLGALSGMLVGSVAAAAVARAACPVVLVRDGDRHEGETEGPRMSSSAWTSTTLVTR